MLSDQELSLKTFVGYAQVAHSNSRTHTLAHNFPSGRECARFQYCVHGVECTKQRSRVSLFLDSIHTLGCSAKDEDTAVTSLSHLETAAAGFLTCYMAFMQKEKLYPLKTSGSRRFPRRNWFLYTHRENTVCDINPKVTTQANCKVVP